MRRLLWGLYLFMWVCGLVAYLFLGGPPPHVGWTAPLFLLLAGLLVLLGVPDGRSALLLMAAAVVGFASEVIGVHTGIPYGAYHYTEVLGVSVWGVPLVLAAAWIVLAAYGREVGRDLARELRARCGQRRPDLPPAGRVEMREAWLEIALGASWMTLIDLLIDPLAAGPLGYWRWAAPGAYFGIPASNFLGWLGVSSVALLVLLPARESRTARRVGGSVLLFFAALAAGLGYFGPALLGLLLLAADLGLARRQRKITSAEGVSS